jgi:threonine dehydratase
MTRPLDIDRIRDATKHIDPVFLETPLLRRTPLDTELGCELLFKVETLNPIRSFKGRGAELFAATELTAGTPVICASAANFGQTLAYAATPPRNWPGGQSTSRWRRPRLGTG